jgi:3-oxoacyl-[acyl-carrier protein] reductase
MIAYTVGKAGVLALTRGLAREFGRKGFRVNVMLPGGIHTPGTRSVIRSALRGVRFDLMRTGWDFQGRLALGRWGQPDEVARVALFLASDLASYVQGALIPVDGGFLSS